MFRPAGTGPPECLPGNQALHVYGSCRVFDEPQRLAQIVEALSQRYESAFNNPWQPEYGAAMLQAIVGVEIEIEEIQCKYKLSQNRPSADHGPVIDELEDRGAEALAAAMRKTLVIAGHLLREPYARPESTPAIAARRVIVVPASFCHPRISGGPTHRDLMVVAPP